MNKSLFSFVVMPFDKKFDDIYEVGIKQACIDENIYCERVDKQIFKENILQRIYNQINKADIIIADISGKNPNVLYEVGYAHGVNADVILITKDVEDIPFDLRIYQHIIYGDSIAKLKDELVKRLKWRKDNPQKENKILNIEAINVYLEGALIMENTNVNITIYELEHNNIRQPILNFAINNPTEFPIELGSIKFAVVLPKDVFVDRSVERAILSNDEAQIRMFFESTLWPQSWSSFHIGLNYSNFYDLGSLWEPKQCKLVIYSIFGKIEKPFTINFIQEERK